MSETQENEHELLLEQALETLESCSNILGKQSGESVTEAAQRVVDELMRLGGVIAKLKENLVNLMEIGDDVAYCVEHNIRKGGIGLWGEEDAKAWRAKAESVKATLQ